MAEGFRVIDIDAAEKALRIDILASQGDGFSVSETDMLVTPPITTDEHDRILEKVGVESALGRQLVSGVEIGDESLKFTLDGTPSEAHRWYGVELAKQIVALKGIGAALVVTCIDNETRQELVLDTTTPTGGSDVQVALVH